MQLKSSEMKLGYGLLMVWSCIIWICFLLSLTVAPLASFSSSTTWRQARWPAFLKPTLLRLKYSRKGHVLFQEQHPKSYWFSLAPTRSHAHSWTNHCHQENTELLLVRSGLDAGVETDFDSIQVSWTKSQQMMMELSGLLLKEEEDNR